MENSWQNKCTSSWTSIPTPSQQGARNQIEMSAGSFAHPYVTQEVSSVSSGFVRQPMVFNNSNLGSCTSGNPELGNSFLSLLSGPSSQLQRGVQSMPSSISFLNSSKLPTQKDNIVSGGDSYGVPLAPVALLSPQLGNHNMRTGTDHFLVVPSRASSTSSPRFLDMHSMQQMTNVTYNSEINQTGLHPLTRGNEMGTDLFYPRQGWLSSLNLPNGQHSSTNIQPSLNVPSVTKSATSGPESSFAKGCPRVFCLATNGELLLNNKGLLGVVCLCHGFQMSISKFCEHSGSCIVNPGDAVRLESGETVSQWRRMYFPKYGIRVPDDNSGWDWPERNPATVGLMNRKATVLNTSKNSDMFKVVDQSVAPTRSRQYRNKFASQNNSRIGESVMENTFSDVMNNVRHRNTQGECKVPLKSLAGTAQTILSAPEEIQTMHIVKGGPRSIGSEKAREETGYQSISDYIDFLTKGGDTLIANHQSLGNFRFRGTGSDVSNGNDSRECIVERDGISSNIELRLGQPSQHRYNLEGSVISAMQSPPFVAYNIHQKSQDPIFHNAVIPSVTEESRQHLQSVPSNASNSQRWDESKFTFKQLVPGNHAEAGQFKGDITKSSHKLFSNSNILSEGNVMSRASDNMINFSGTSMSRALPGESHGTSGPSDFPRNRSGGKQAHLNNDLLCHLYSLDKEKSAHHILDNGSYSAAEGNSFFHNTQLAGSSPFSGVFSHSRLASDTTLDGKQSPYWCHLLGVPPDASNISNQSNPHGNASFIQRKSFLDQAPLRAVNSSTVSSGSGVPLSEVSCFSSTNSIYRPTLMRMSNKESVDVTPHFLDENLRLLALRRTLDLKQKHVVSNDMEREQGRVCIPSTVEMQQRTSIIGSVAPEELKEGPYLTIKKDNPEFGAKQLQKCSNRFVDGNFEKSAGVTGVKKWCNFSTSSHDIGHPHDPLIDNQPLPSLGRIISNAVKTSEHDVCRQREPSPFFTGNCSCAVHSEDFVGSCVIRGEVPDDANKTHFGRIIGSTSKPVPSIFDNDHIVQHKTSTLNGFENLNRQIRVQNECHASQWRDVPSKRIRVENATCIEKPTELFDAINVEAQVVGTAGKNATQQAESLNEQQMSNMYSGCSAPVVTEVTGEVNTRDSWTVDAGNNRYTSEHVVDEGSGIERCWSSDDAHGSERSTETVNVSHKHDSTRGGKSSSYLPSLSLQGRACDFRLERSFGLKKVQKWHPAKCSGNESIGKKQPSKSNFQVRKRKKTIKWKRLDASFPASGLSSVQYDSPQSVGDTESHSCSSRGTQILSKLGHGWKRTCGVHANQSSHLKQKCSTVLSAKTLSRKRNICELADHHREGQDGCRKQMKDDSNHLKKSKSSSEKKSKKRGAPDLSEQLPNMEMSKRDAGKLPKYSSMNHAKEVSSNQADTIDKKTKPVVCGEFGIISSGKLGEDPIKLAKIVSLSTVLRTARICSTEEPGVGSTVKTKKKCFKRSSECYGKLSILEDEGMGSEYYSIVMKNKELAGNFMLETKMPSLSEDNTCVDELSMPGKDEICADDRTLKHSTPSSGAPLKSRFKEARKRSLYELAGKAVDLSNSSCLPTKAPKRALRSTFKSHRKSFLKKVDGNSKCHRVGFSQRSNIKSVKKQQKDQPYTLDSDAFCSVCGSSKKDDDNCLLECSTCLIRVHQACYGIARVPKVRWSCRPCRGDSRHNVCVLCGYEGGAMTQALKSRNIVKGLLEAWSITLESKSKKFSPLSETSKDELRLSDTSGDEDELYSDHGTRPVIQQSPSAMLVEDSLDKMDIVQPSNDIPSILQVHNSITAGIGDPTIKQWVHMVCGLWTPSTRCPNVDTMSAFDVSGVLRPPMNVVCSMCNRPGGSCIQCRVVSCSVHFHPWCAHQKGLLQSEVEGVDNDKVGFYGRCMLHATQQNSDSVIRLIDSDLDSLGKEEFSCARTEGYKGRKKDGFRHKLHGRSNVNGECVVPQEQIDAWLHINGQKSCARGILKSQTSDIENDCRKEYARYKQAIGWKNLVVYKSGIHGLGLYTSQFISRGAMVVEYVGEIVGLRVADKREVEYQSGRKLQYKGACYFFRIDKEHIIDATRKGGIARFVNHSCLPNCVAKIISPRNEKKVVFFAERDIYPGEEVTYDYHFNHEDEGEKIPCFCNSKNCRRFLN